MGPLTLQLGVHECPRSTCAKHYCAEPRLLHLCPITFPVLPMSQTTFFFVSYPVNIQTLHFQRRLWVVVISSLGCLGNKPSLYCKLQPLSGLPYCSKWQNEHRSVTMEKEEMSKETRKGVGNQNTEWLFLPVRAVIQDASKGCMVASCRNKHPRL